MYYIVYIFIIICHKKYELGLHFYNSKYINTQNSNDYVFENLNPL